MSYFISLKEVKGTLDTSFITYYIGILLATIFSVEFDINIIRHHYSTSFFDNIIRHISTIFDTIRHVSTGFSVEPCRNIIRQHF